MQDFDNRYTPVADRIKIDADVGNRNDEYVPKSISSEAIRQADDMRDVMLNYYQTLSKGRATANDKYNASVCLSLLTGKPMSEVTTNFDYYMGMFGGVDNSKGFWQAFGNKFKQFYVNKDIASLQNWYDGSENEDEKAEILKQIEMKEREAISLEDPNDRGWFGNSLTDFAPILAQGMDMGITTGTTALAMGLLSPVASAYPIFTTTANVLQKAVPHVVNFANIWSTERGSVSRELYKMAQEEEIELDEGLRKTASTVIGGLTSLIEVATLDPVLKMTGLSKKTVDKIARTSLKDIAWDVLKRNIESAKSEGIEEFGQQLVTYWGEDIVKKLHNQKSAKDFKDKDVEEKIKESLLQAGEAFVSVLSPAFVGGSLSSIATELGRYGGRKTVDMVNEYTAKQKAEALGYNVKNTTPMPTSILYSNPEFREEAIKQAKEQIESGEEEIEEKNRELLKVNVVRNFDNTSMPKTLQDEVEYQKALLNGEQFVNFVEDKKESKKQSVAEKKSDFIIRETIDETAEENHGIIDGNTITFATTTDRDLFIKDLKSDVESFGDDYIEVREDDGFLHRYEFDILHDELNLDESTFSKQDKADIDYILPKLRDYFSRSEDENKALALMTSRVAKSHGMTGIEFFDTYIENIEQDDELEARGQVTFGKDMKAVITAGRNATPQTFEHELMHIVVNIADHKKEFQRMFNKLKESKRFRRFVDNSPALKTFKSADFDKIYNSKEWTAEEYEFFNEMYEAYRSENKHLDKDVGNFFNKITSWFKSIYKALKGKFGLNDEVVKYFDKLFSATKRFNSTIPEKRETALTLTQLDEETAKNEEFKHKSTVVNNIKRSLGTNGKFNTYRTEDVELLINNRVYVPQSVLENHKDSKVVQQELAERVWISNLVKAHPEFKNLAKKSKTVEAFLNSTGVENENTKRLLEKFYSYSKVRTPVQILNDFLDQYGQQNDGVLRLYKVLANNTTVRRKLDGTYSRVRFRAGSKLLREFPPIDSKSSDEEFREAMNYVNNHASQIVRALLKAKMNLERLDYFEGKNADFLTTSAELAYLSMTDEDFLELSQYVEGSRASKQDAGLVDEIEELRANMEKYLTEQERQKLKEETEVLQAVYVDQITDMAIKFADETKQLSDDFDARIEALHMAYEEAGKLVGQLHEEEIDKIKSACEWVIDEHYKEFEGREKKIKKELRDTKAELKKQKDKYANAMWYHRYERDEQHRKAKEELRYLLNKEIEEHKADKKQAKVDKQQAKFDQKQALKKQKEELMYKALWRRMLDKKESQEIINSLAKDFDDEVKALVDKQYIENRQKDWDHRQELKKQKEDLEYKYLWEKLKDKEYFREKLDKLREEKNAKIESIASVYHDKMIYRGEVIRYNAKQRTDEKIARKAYEAMWREKLIRKEDKEKYEKLKESKNIELKNLAIWYREQIKRIKYEAWWHETLAVKEAKEHVTEVFTRRINRMKNRYYSQVLDRRIKRSLTLNKSVHHVSAIEPLVYIRDLVNNNQFKYVRDDRYHMKKGKMSNDEYAKIKLFKGTVDEDVTDMSYTINSDGEFEILYNAEFNSGEHKFDLSKIPVQLKNNLNSESIQYLTDGKNEISAFNKRWESAPISVKENVLYALKMVKREAKEHLKDIKEERRNERADEMVDILNNLFDDDIEKDNNVIEAWQRRHNTTEMPSKAQLSTFYAENYKLFNKKEEFEGDTSTFKGKIKETIYNAKKKVGSTIGGAIGHIQGICLLIDGKNNGPMYKAFVTDVQPYLDEFYRNKQRRLAEADKVLRAYTGNEKILNWLKGEYELQVNDGGEYSTRGQKFTGFNLLGAYIYSKNIFGFIKLVSTAGNNISIDEMVKINPQMTYDLLDLELGDWLPKRATNTYNSLMSLSEEEIMNLRTIFKDYSKDHLQKLKDKIEASKNEKGEYDIERLLPKEIEEMGNALINMLGEETERLKDVALNEHNAPFFIQANYFPLINALGGNTDIAIGQAIKSSDSVYNGMLKGRHLIDNYALLLDPIAIFYSAIDAQERLINLSEPVHRLNNLLDSKGGNLKSIISDKFGSAYAGAIESYVKTLAGQDDNGKLTEYERMYNTLIGNYAFSVLGFNILSSLKQFISLTFAGAQGEVTFGDIIRASTHLGVDDDIFEIQAPEIANSGFNYEIDKHIADKIKTYGYEKRKKIEEIGMAHIEKADMITKKLVWFARYYKAIEEGMDTQEASLKATDLVKRTLSVSNPENLSQLQRKKDPFARAVFMFSTDLFQLWNSIYFGVPNDIKNGNKDKAFAKLLGLTLTATALALAKGGFLPDNDEEGIDFKQFIKDMISSHLQLTPAIGSILQDEWDGWNGSLVTIFNKVIGFAKLPLRNKPASGYEYADRFLDILLSTSGALGLPTLAIDRSLKLVLPEGIKKDGIDLDIRNLGYVLTDNFGDFLHSL